MEVRFSNVFWKIYDAAKQRPRVISNRGGTRSGKTFSTLQFLHQLIQAADKAGDVTSVVSESLPHLKRGAIRDFEKILGVPLKADDAWNATELTYTYPSGAKLEFFSVDSPNKVLGPARKRLFVNEANHISFDTYRQLAVRTTGTIFIDYNPAALFWAIEKVEPRANTITIVTTYRDNIEFLSREQVEEIEANKSDARWWKVYGEGEVGTLDGVIYDINIIDKLPDDVSAMREVYGIDFGFTNDPTAIVRCLIDTRRKAIYLQQIAYKRRMLNDDIDAALLEAGVPVLATIYADCAEPKSIEDLKRKRWKGIRPCYKATRKAEQIAKLQGYTIYVTADSLDVINEGREYTWQTDKDGNKMNEPIEFNDHAMDAFRYACFTYLINSNTGKYFIK